MANPRQSVSIPEILARVERPKRAVVTAGMPYANGQIHLGHLAGAHVPADIHARYLGMLIGRENVLFVCGSDDHGSTSEVAALQAGVPIRELVDRTHARHAETLARYAIDLDVYSGTSQPEIFRQHCERSWWFLSRLRDNGLLEKRSSHQWYDPALGRFLPDRLVRGKCPNPKCDNEDAYSDECGVCGKQYLPSELKNPRSALSSATPEMRETTHWWLDMWKVSDTMRTWIEGKQKSWRQLVLSESLERVYPNLRVAGDLEDAYKAVAATLPPHKRKWAPGRNLLLQFRSMAEYETGKELLASHGIPGVAADEWAHRPLTRDVSWGIPITPELDPDLVGKTLYVWPDSLIAPISFSQLALEKRGEAHRLGE